MEHTEIKIFAPLEEFDRKTILMVVILLFIAPITGVAQPSKAAFTVPLSHVESYVVLYKDIFKNIDVELEEDEGKVVLDEVRGSPDFRLRTKGEYVFDRTPDNVAEWVALGIYYAGDHRYKKQYQKAEEAFKKALEIDPNSFEAHAFLFYIYDAKVDARTLSTLRNMEVLAKNVKHYGVLGVVYLPIETNPVGDAKKCKDYLEKAINDDPNYYPAYYYLAWYSHFIEHDDTRAVNYIKRYTELNPEDPRGWQDLERYSSTYPPPGKRDPFELVIVGIGIIFALNVIRLLWKRRKSKRISG